MTTWIFQANPDRFDIEALLGTSPATISWVARQHAAEMQVGDQVFIWRAIGKGDKRLSGIVSEGFIKDGPTERADDPVALSYWREGAPDIETRVRLRLTRIELGNKRFLRDWLDQDPILGHTAILTLRSSTNFRLSSAEASRLNALWRRAKEPWTYPESVAGLWAFQRTLGSDISRKPGSPVSVAALRSGRVVKGMYNKVLNFRALDPNDARAGLDGTSAMDVEIWSRFFDPAVGKLDVVALESEFARLFAVTELPLLPTEPSADQAAVLLAKLSLAELQARYAAKHEGTSRRPRTYQTTATSFQRDPDVIAIARLRSGGKCEMLDCAHPLFRDPEGNLFLEVHHIKPLAEGGEDSPENVAAICPSHHREAHHGSSAVVLRLQLKALRAGEANGANSVS